ncbi:hypothetical protein F503_00532 [Ophiostoma piceae UAMH 11346]|uniref:TeaA receptor TeaR n=1 Tax=Ophiostoma piceae (strain UAMH 11346) TaxID=1262450 RepID=S3D3B6_OPHP1|nr:hypothetical protein F503_00532 [Ophiostoma piceae UAMH 11346]
MAAVSAAQTATSANSTTLTPPSSSHGNGYAWDNSLQQLEDPAYTQRANLKSHVPQNGVALTYGSLNPIDEPIHKSSDFGAVLGQENIRPGRSRDTSVGVTDRNPENHDSSRSTSTTKRPGALGPEREDKNSKWIHRDKLARIESEELQAAGIILPRSRARSKPRRDISVDRSTSYRKAAHEPDFAEPQSHKNSTNVPDHRPVDIAIPEWDLRLPDEIAEESYFTSPYGTGVSSRIPVAKISPAPIALDKMERETPMPRRRDESPGTEESIAYPKPRSRSASMRPSDGYNGPHSPPRVSRSTSDMSPRKASGGIGASASTPTLRKASGASKAMPTSGRPKTRNGTSKDSNSSGTGATRPSTRSGERELSREMSAGAASRQPEGEPPWMISAYRPDPRLPPDQQLLPTVARRLQQEKWEREGKFGNVYDKEFRPLTDDGFLSPPEMSEKPGSADNADGQSGEKHDEWPLKPEAKSPTMPPGRAGSYSTIPKIQEKPNMSPLASPRPPLAQGGDAGTAPAAALTRDEEDAKQGCGCCVIM